MNNKYQIRYLPIAEQDLSEIIDYIRIDDPGIAMKLLDQIDELVSKLEDFPSLGKVPKDRYLQYQDYRILVVSSYLIFYVIDEPNSTVEIRRIIHGRRK